jgi:hypothetical protein
MLATSAQLSRRCPAWAAATQLTMRHPVRASRLHNSAAFLASLQEHCVLGLCMHMRVLWRLCHRSELGKIETACAFCCWCVQVASW